MTPLKTFLQMGLLRLRATDMSGSQKFVSFDLLIGYVYKNKNSSDDQSYPLAVNHQGPKYDLQKRKKEETSSHVVK